MNIIWVATDAFCTEGRESAVYGVIVSIIAIILGGLVVWRAPRMMSDAPKEGRIDQLLGVALVIGGAVGLWLSL